MKLISLILVSLIFTACGEYLKGKPATASYLEINGNGKLACLDNVSSDLQKFLDSTDSNNEIDQTVNCINTTLTELQARVEGRVESSSFTADEVYQILANFASSAKVSLDATKNLIVLKAVLLGGEKTKITKAEIDLLKKYLLIVKDEAKNLKPYIQLFYFKSTNKAYSKSFIQAAIAQVNASLKKLYKNSQLASANYSVDQFKDLVLGVFSLGTEKQAMVEVATSLNALLNQAPVLDETSRVAYIDNITEALKLFSYYVNGYAKFEINTSSELNETISFVESLVSLVENSLQYKKTQVISVSTLDAFVSAFVKSSILSYKIPSYTAAMIYRTILVRVFESGASGNINAFSALKSFHIKNIKREVGIYKLYSKMLEQVANEALFASRGIVSAPLVEIQRNLGAINIANESDILNQFDSATQMQIVNAVNDLRSEFTSANPIIFYNKKIAIAANQNSWTQNWKDLSRGLYNKMLARLLMQGWGAVYPLENINTNYLTETAMYNWYSEFKNVGIALKKFDPRTFNSGPTSVKTGNLFTRSGNGDSTLTFKELAESLAILTTGSSLIEEAITNDLAVAHCNLPELDVFDKNWNHETCLYQVLRDNYKSYYAQIPNLVAYLNSLSEAQFNSYFREVMNVVRFDAANTGLKIETADIRSMNALLQFIEVVYLNHDADSNFALSETEIRQAYPKFQAIAVDYANKTSAEQIQEFTSAVGTVAGFGCFSEQDLIRESFVYLIYNGHSPQQANFNSFPCFRGKPLMNFSGEVSRSTLVNTFKALKSVLGN